MSLSRNYPPSQVSRAFSPQLQAGVMSAFPSVLGANHASNVPKICHLAQAYDEDFAVRWIQDQLMQVNEFAGVKSKLSDMQLDELSIQIRLEYGYLNLFEFILFCARLRSGRYEDFYGSVDPMRILKSLDSFCQERQVELNKEAAAKEKIEREREYEESRRNAVSFDEWYSRQTEEEKAKIRDSPHFGAFAKAVEERKDNEHKSKR